MTFRIGFAAVSNKLWSEAAVGGGVGGMVGAWVGALYSGHKNFSIPRQPQQGPLGSVELIKDVAEWTGKGAAIGFAVGGSLELAARYASHNPIKNLLDCVGRSCSSSELLLPLISVGVLGCLTIYVRSCRVPQQPAAAQLSRSVHSD